MAEASSASSNPPPSHAPVRSAGSHRVHSSCDRCRSRKTKCIDPIPGPCRYCARTGASCQIATPRRKRPYYHVTEEEYQCAMRVLEHFFPDRELNLANLREIARDVAEGKVATATSGPPRAPATGEDDYPDDEGSPDGVEPAAEAVNDLHEPLGCLMKDSLGRFRYVGAHSEIPFNAAVCAMGRSRRNPNIIASPKVGSYPPALPTPATADVELRSRYYFPRRELGDFYISRFLEHVHCTHWLYSIETFLHRVDSTYAQRDPPPSASWMCSLYAIFAIGAANYEEPTGQSPLASGSPAASDNRASADYITLAKELIPSVYDEADLDSIRALAIMSIAMENLMSRTSSYLYMGASIQMAYSLGLHRDQAPESASSMDREQNRRVWWTLFMLDQEIASRGGSPTLIDERHLKISTPLPSEQVLYPGMHTPLGWQETSVSLCRFKREIIQAVYTERLSNSRTISFSTISNLLVALQKWLQLIPPHLKHDVPAPPTHKRAVAVLHLHYWGSMILLCRPFLLYLVFKHSTLAPSKRIWFERMGKTCIDAAQKSNAILQQMALDKSLSSLSAHDGTCILRIVMIFVLAYAHTKLPQYRTHIETALNIVRSMEQVGFTKMVSEETPMRLSDLGMNVTPVDSNEAHSGVLLDDELIAQIWGNFDPNFMTPLQTQQTLDIAFDETSAFDMMEFTSLDDSIVLDPSQAFQHYDFR